MARWPQQIVALVDSWVALIVHRSQAELYEKLNLFSLIAGPGCLWIRRLNDGVRYLAIDIEDRLLTSPPHPNYSLQRLHT